MTTGQSIKASASPVPRSHVQPLSKHTSEFGTLLLATVAAIALFIPRFESTRSVSLLIVSALLSAGLPWGIWWFLREDQSPKNKLIQYAPVIITAWVLWSMLTELFSRAIGLGEAPEILMLTTLQNAGLITAAYSHWRRCQQVACLISSFLTLYVLIICSQPVVFVLAGLFGVMMLWWLMARYWERVSNTYASHRSDRCLPVRSSVLASVAGGLLLLAALFGTTGGATYVLGGFMPTSGGNSDSNDLARSGVGDGDAMVAAQEDANSFGPVESDLFLESEMPSLYDMMNEAYGEPLKPPKKRERAMGLPQGNMKITHQRTAKTERSGKEFSTVRRMVERTKSDLKDRKAPALLHVVGRVPLHLAIERFDTFNGRDWEHSNEKLNHSNLSLQRQDEKPWVQVQPAANFAIPGGLETHGVKLINLKTKRVPSPPQITAVHIDKIDLVDFYGWSTDGVVELPQRDLIPQLTVLYTQSAKVNLTSLRELDFTESFRTPRQFREDQQNSWAAITSTTMKRHLEIPPQSQKAATLAAEWTKGVPRGWQQVEAIVSHLRSEFTRDSLATVPEASDDVVSHFLNAGRGPDYLFATTAAVMLRSQGYPTRLVTGFYADPQNYDRAGGQTIVLPEDVHAWAEVGVGGSKWVAIEPTPGYEPPPEVLTWKQQFAQLAAAMLSWLKANVVLLLSGGLVLFSIWYTRFTWLDWGFISLIRLWRWGHPIHRIRATLYMLEYRSWLAGLPRPATVTVRQWYLDRSEGLSEKSRNQLSFFINILERTLYAPATLQTTDRDQTAHACRNAIQHLRTPQLRSWAQQGDLQQ
ncbi:Transglutaminase-like superfamily protein [Symmachiella macrocystis]|uniref:Transglutaminase-like superfamily protein n=1 Tax=Symmachiella macrocystis TaxID=2527985 RepID=A0A5C6AZL8_9PLAN|nr:transglutaminase-like domain-containing protein [Symmachiella macrocystis]TWU05160.1 Transglutaminase-like superfamily protein [Symmachiella macrocystis]